MSVECLSAAELRVTGKGGLQHSTSSHTFAPCDLPLSVGESERHERVLWGRSQTHKEVCESAAT